MLLTGALFAQGATPKKDMQVMPAPNQNPNLKPRLTPDDAPMFMMEQLNLSKDQMAKLQDVRLEHQKRMNTLRAEVENLRLDIQKAIQGEKYSDAKKLNDTLYQKKKDMANAAIDHIQAMMKELTSDQKEIAKEHFMMRGQGFHGKGDCMMQRKGMGQGHMGQGNMQMHNRKGNGKGQGMGMMHGNNMGNCEDCEDCQENGPQYKHQNRPNTPTQK
jgi:hypothetical protein